MPPLNVEENGFSVPGVRHAAHDGESGARLSLSGDYDVVVLDVMLPRLNGFEALQRIRAASKTPVLMLTARGDDVDRIVGLEMGSDDYLPKPCNPRELVARLRAILRRTQSSPTTGGHGSIRVDNLVVHPASRRAVQAGQTLVLTSTEYNILEVLVRNAGRLVAKDTLSQQALGRKLTRYDRSIDMHVSKLKAGVNEQPLIQTVRGLGYQFRGD